MNRLKKKTQDPSLGTFWVSYAYYADGRRDTITDSTGRSTVYSYDERNRLKRKVNPEGVLKYTYDDDGNVLTLQSAKNDGSYQAGYGGISLIYAWDNLNRLKTVTDVGAGNLVTTYVHDLLDRVTDCIYPAATGVKHTYSYNDANWLTGVTIKKNSSPVGSFTNDFARASGSTYYGRTGTRMGVTETGRTVQYEYDPLYRLTKENVLSGSPSGIVTYDGTPGYADTGGFDKVGNRRSRGSNLAGVPAVGQTTYTGNDKLPADGYDANGNTTTSSGLTYGYDFENHLTSRNGSPALSYAYDQDGNRVKKVSGSTTTYYLVDEKSPTGYPQVVEELSVVGANPTLLKTYTHGLKLISQRPAGGQVQYYGHDGQGSTRLLFDNSGNVSQTYAYDAFGILISPTTPPAGNDYLYAGEQFDRDLGLYYLRARYYNPQTGRFSTRDTYEGDQEDPLSLHTYLYCHANPANGTDPGGHEGDFVSTMGSMAINNVVSGMAFSTVTRGYDAAKAFCAGQALGAIAEEAAIGMGEDAIINLATLGLSKAVALRRVGQVFQRAAGSVWGLGWGARGRLIEQKVAKLYFCKPQLTIKGVPLSEVASFKVIDDFTAGVASSVKSIDLTGKSYQTAVGLTKAISRNAEKLANFSSEKLGAVIVTESEITERVLVVAYEPGAATLEQAGAIQELVKTGYTGVNGAKVRIRFVPVQ